MIKAFANELPDAVAALLKGWADGIRLLVGNYPIWGDFNEAAGARELTPTDVANIVKVAASAVSDLEKAERVDPEVPRTIALLQSLVADREAAPKRVAFALLRTLENLAARVFRHVGAILEAVPAGMAEGVKTVSKWGVIVAVLNLATYLMPLTASVPGLAWLAIVKDAVTAAMDKGE